MTLTDILGSTLSFVWDIIATVCGFLYDILSKIPISETPWINFIISLLIILFILGIIGYLVDQAKEKEREAEWAVYRAEREAREAKEKAELEAEEKAKQDAENTCPKCHAMYQFVLESKKEIDRYQINKEVWERKANGKDVSRYVKCTKVVEEFTYVCDNCHDYRFTKEETRELE
ncbi:hypothetical protein A4G18_05055 [Pasteurellaceae bacterium Pebbles2]|nr:hypothetical protein [Pasteurellaceae bacterium Pebbles2]